MAMCTLKVVPVFIHRLLSTVDMVML